MFRMNESGPRARLSETAARATTEQDRSKPVEPMAVNGRPPS